MGVSDAKLLVNSYVSFAHLDLPQTVEIFVNSICAFKIDNVFALAAINRNSRNMNTIRSRCSSSSVKGTILNSYNLIVLSAILVHQNCTTVSVEGAAVKGGGVSTAYTVRPFSTESASCSVAVGQKLPFSS